MAAWLREHGRALLLAALVLGGAAFLALRAQGVFTPFLLAAALAYLLDPAVSLLERRGLGRAWAILLLYAVIGLLTTAAVLFLLPALVGQVESLAEGMPRIVERVQSWIDWVQSSYRRLDLPAPAREAIDRQLGGVEARAIALAQGMAGGLLGFFSGLASLILSPILAFYILRDLPEFRRRFERALPKGRRTLIRRYLGEVDTVLSGFIRGQLLDALVVGLLASLLLSLIGVRYALLFGLLSGLFNVIPYFGPLLGALPALAAAALDSWTHVLWTGLAFVVLQQIDSAILAPRIVGRSVGLHPLAVIFALLAGGQLLGFVGLLLAVPVAGVLRVTLVYLYRWAIER